MASLCLASSFVPACALQAYGIYGSERYVSCKKAEAAALSVQVSSADVTETMYLSKTCLVYCDKEESKSFGILQKGQSVGILSKDEKVAEVKAGFRKGYLPVSVLTDTKPEEPSDKESGIGKADFVMNESLKQAKEDLASEMNEDEIPEDQRAESEENTEEMPSEDSESGDYTDTADKTHTIAIVKNGKVVYTTLEKARSRRGIAEDSDVEVREDENEESGTASREDPKTKGILTKESGRNESGPFGAVETYYSLDMSGVVSIMRSLGYTEDTYPYSVRDDGVKTLGGYVMVAADLHQYPRGSFVWTSLGRGIVCDTGEFTRNGSGVTFDIATN